jgi:hypothetical protein
MPLQYPSSRSRCPACHVPSSGRSCSPGCFSTTASPAAAWHGSARSMTAHPPLRRRRMLASTSCPHALSICSVNTSLPSLQRTPSQARFSPHSSSVVAWAVVGQHWRHLHRPSARPLDARRLSTPRRAVHRGSGEGAARPRRRYRDADLHLGRARPRHRGLHRSHRLDLRAGRPRSHAPPPLHVRNAVLFNLGAKSEEVALPDARSDAPATLRRSGSERPHLMRPNSVQSGLGTRTPLRPYSCLKGLNSSARSWPKP